MSLRHIGQFMHPKHGLYHIYYDSETGCFGLSHTIHPLHCGYATLAAAMTAKGL